MVRPIDPTVDYAFKQIFEDPEVLKDFLQSTLTAEGFEIESVTITNPFNDREFEQDKMTVVDVKAMDNEGRKFQVEIQLSVHGQLHARIAYTWADFYGSQIKKGEGFEDLSPVFSIWILGQTLFPESPSAHHRFILYDPENKVALSDHLAIHTLELPKCPNENTIVTALDRWMYLFGHGKDFDPADPPASMKTDTMRKVMSTLVRISLKQKEYWRYQSRLDARREAECMRREVALATKSNQEAQAERRRSEAARKKATAALRRSETAQKKSEAAQKTSEAAQKKSEAAQKKSEAAQKKSVADLKKETSARKKTEAALKKLEVALKKSEDARRQAEQKLKTDVSKKG